MAPYHRPFLATARTTLRDPTTGEQFPFQGLYTTVDLPAGAFLGFYNGVFRDGSFRGRDAYVFALSNVYIRPKKKRGVVDAWQYPLAMCNEPELGKVANVYTVEFTRAKDVIPHLHPKTEVAALGFYTCRPVKGGEELFVHYGKYYDRSHYYNPNGRPPRELIGSPCRGNKDSRETPMGMAQTYGLYYVDSECYVVLE